MSNSNTKNKQETNFNQNNESSLQTIDTISIDNLYWSLLKANKFYCSHFLNDQNKNQKNNEIDNQTLYTACLAANIDYRASNCFKLKPENFNFPVQDFSSETFNQISSCLSHDSNTKHITDTLLRKKDLIPSGCKEISKFASYPKDLIYVEKKRDKNESISVSDVLLSDQLNETQTEIADKRAIAQRICSKYHADFVNCFEKVQSQNAQNKNENNNDSEIDFHSACFEQIGKKRMCEESTLCGRSILNCMQRSFDFDTNQNFVQCYSGKSGHSHQVQNCISKVRDIENIDGFSVDKEMDEFSERIMPQYLESAFDDHLDSKNNHTENNQNYTINDKTKSRKSEVESTLKNYCKPEFFNIKSCIDDHNGDETKCSPQFMALNACIYSRMCTREFYECVRIQGRSISNCMELSSQVIDCLSSF